MSTFKPRMTKPEAGNPYYNTKANGGYSMAIKGKPTDAGCDVLANCVGYAYGRFNEIGGWGSCKYLVPTNAENFIQHKGSLEVGQTPKLGACMVWRRGATLSGSDGAGHVAIVEKVISDTEVVTSESGWNSSRPFWTQTRKKGSDGRWGSGSSYTFLGFIYNPAPCCKGTGTAASTGSTSTTATKLTVDGMWGTATTKRLQEIFGTTVDGVVSNQYKRYQSDNPGLKTGLDWKDKPNGKGSALIRAMQKWAGMPANQQDGEFGPRTCCAIQKKLGTPQDGTVSSPSLMVKSLQRWANQQK